MAEPIEIIDTPVDVTRYLPKLPDVHTVIRYITRGAPNGYKQIKAKEAQAIRDAGKKLAIVHETWGDFAHAGNGGISRSDGEKDGPFAVRCLRALGAPPGAGCYFAVDTDGSPSQLKNNVLPYFKACAEAFEGTGYRVGIYGPGSFCKATQKAGLTELWWLANAKGWAGYKEFLPEAHIVQRLPTHIAGGLDVDPNVQQKDDWGQFTPFEADDRVLSNNDFEGVPGRLGQGERVVGTADMTDADGGSLITTAKSVFRSKIAWIAGGLGGTGAGSALSSDPSLERAFYALLSKPTFWLVLLCLGLAGALIYYRWRDHGRGQRD